MVFQSLLLASFLLKLSKCLFVQVLMDYLGHIISHGKVALEPSKISTIVDWQFLA